MKQTEPSNPRYKSICLPVESEADYLHCVAEAAEFRRFLDRVFNQYPELFPAGMAGGYTLHDRYFSRKQGFYLRRIKLRSNGAVYQIRPSIVVPYLAARTADLEKPLYLRRYGVPFEALAYVFGRNPMYYYRAWLSLGRQRIVGTTLKRTGLPAHLIADEKQTWLLSEKRYLATTVGGGCFLGAALCEDASTEGLKKGYGEFQREAREAVPDYKPVSVCTDGWKATREAWRLLWPKVILILCYLHSVLKIRERCREALREEVLGKAWKAYQGRNKREFAQRLRRFGEWAVKQTSGAVQEMIVKLCRLKDEFLTAYEVPEAARTSARLDRLMDYQDRVLYQMKYFHGHQETARLAVRAMALQWNFHPYSERAQRNGLGESPFVELNGFEYRENWLENLLCAASQGGRRL